MFLEKTIDRNPNLIKAAFYLHQEGVISPDTYVLDYDMILENAKMMKKEADKYGIKLYFMGKQIGRNPLICKALVDMGFEGAVAVDYKDAKIHIENGIKLGHVGHLVQIPKNDVELIVSARPQTISIYSIEKAKEISKAAVKLNVKQNITLRVIDDEDMLYPAQYGGFYLKDLEKVVDELRSLPNIVIHGLTSFPCFLYDSKEKKIKDTHNLKTVLKAKDILKDMYINIEEVNLPSANCTESMKLIKSFGGTHGEPGHGFTGTTPFHGDHDNYEKPAMVYVSEVSHNLNSNSYCYGGGYYRRSNLKKALVGTDINNGKLIDVEEPSLESIDYYFTLKENTKVSDTVIMAFRTQIFVTRSDVAIVKGISDGKPELIGLYDSQGRKIR
ncbi:YhfX family PLP-dependent enzyme [Clostridium algidicarnis]|uniref:Putative amino acid racemase n=1 Tax=Clostridium algidicarnis DSM 15099 TaxID=1121295 RepID=A0A2S6FYN8_9CLOT|nr:YhfX family PLP-dependent enzyme [Clostridium algidicarnis]PPK48677.1 putative amino acid racemase [Clostridium algidicarnis DSM 15099]